MMGEATMALAMKACAITNPFCPEAIGSKYPDNSFVKTLTYDILGVPTAINCDSGGNAAQLWVGDIYQASPATVGTWPAVTFTTLLAMQAIPTACTTYRLTSWGLQFSCLGTKMNTKGMLRVRLYSALKGTSFGAMDARTTLADECYDIPLSKLIDTSLFVFSKPLGTNARLFRDANAVTATIANWVNPGWQSIVAAVDGAEASSSTVEIKPFYHFEYVPDESSVLSAYATKPPPANLALQQVAEGTLEKTGSFIEGVAKTVDKIAQSSAFKYIASAAAGLYGGPSAALTVYNGAGTYSAMRGGRVHMGDVD